MFWKKYLIVISVALTGCAGQLRVYDGTQNEVKGIPFKTAEAYVKKGTHKKHTKGGGCSPTPFVEVLSLPTGAQYFVAAQSAQFSKTSFHIKFGDNGAATEIALDSEPSGSEMLKATSEILKTVAPLVGFGVAATAAQAQSASNNLTAQSPPIEKACDAGEDEVNFFKFSEYQK